ncbi:MAG: 1-deoxy-D-xylulose-5-phosphate synthase N-terminal domain-containing protein [Anaerolineaceae bacterium]|nr:1-deoxy-D-xylulose-5-phosphate synthase N-terminal domain-containing protein [Anaerolineaceae bacterium]
MDLASPTTLPVDPSAQLIDTLDEIQRRILWLSTLMIHHANHERQNPDGSKIGGHQASCASAVTILTALYFHFLQPGDRVAIKPHASPVFHAIQYLLGQLDQSYLSSLRDFHGLQAYPSRTKDPDRVDFSTGSVGLGAVAPIFASLAHQYTQAHFGQVTSNRFIALVGDAELDEGNIWEALMEEALAGLGNLIWIVDLNRQSLDRVVPGIRASRLKRLFAENQWHVVEVKYGRRLQALFQKPGGDVLRRRIDEMSNEEYQALIRLPAAQLRPDLTCGRPDLETLLADVPDSQLPEVLMNLGGHDLAEMIAGLKQAETTPNQPTVIFAYTIKGWGLPIAGHPLNHSMLLTSQQMQDLREKLQVPPGPGWAAFDPSSPAGQLCRQTAAHLYPSRPPHPTPSAQLLASSIPDQISNFEDIHTSTQETFGRILFRLADNPEQSSRLVTASPDVSSSTNLIGWINKRGAYNRVEKVDYDSDPQRLLKWKRAPSGQHIELGISEMNLFLLLGMFGLSAELNGQLTIPIGTVYDPFICRGLDALIYALYSQSKFIFAGTPSGITLSPEGGAHQSAITPSIGAELPNLRMYEPGFAVEVDWILLDSIRQCLDRQNGRATYLRLSTRQVDQSLLQPALQRLGEANLRRQVLAGGYRLRDWRDGGSDVDRRYGIQIAASGSMLTEACAAAQTLWNEGVAANVLNLTSPRRLYELWQSHPASNSLAAPWDWLILPDERRFPMVTLQDGASHSLAWLGSVFGAPLRPLGVDTFGQSGSRQDLYTHYQIDAEAVVKAAFDILDQTVAGQ